MFDKILILTLDACGGLMAKMQIPIILFSRDKHVQKKTARFILKEIAKTDIKTKILDTQDFFVKDELKDQLKNADAAIVLCSEDNPSVLKEINELIPYKPIGACLVGNNHQRSVKSFIQQAVQENVPITNTILQFPARNFNDNNPGPEYYQAFKYFLMSLYFPIMQPVREKAAFGAKQ